MDNLEAQTYETFEKDVVKYTQVSAICCEYAFYIYSICSEGATFFSTFIVKILIQN